MEDIPDSHLVAEVVADFQRENPDVGVRIETMHYDLMLELVLGSIQEPDAPNGVVIFDNPWTHDWVRSGLIRPIDDLLARTQSLDWPDFAPALRAAAGLDGHVWGVPFYTWSFGLVYRVDLYEEAGLEPPGTLEELVGHAAALTTDERAGMAMQPRADYNAAEEWCNYLFAAGGSVQGPNGQVTLDSPQARHALSAYSEVFRRSATNTEIDWTFEDSVEALAQGQAAQMVNCHWWLPVLNDPAGKAGELAGRFRLAEIPGGVGILGVWYWAIPRAVDAVQADAAWRFIAWIASRRANAERVARGGSPVRTSTMADPEVWRRGYGREYYEAVERMHRSARPLMQGANAEEATRVIGAAVHDVVAERRDVDSAVREAGLRVAELLEG
jgi:ABC-type glycerol-3-phosphate transport system substrate-binding protein